MATPVSQAPKATQALASPPITVVSMPPTSSTTTQALAATLLTSGLTIAVAESLTGGAVAAELASVPGISAALVGGIVAYHTTLKNLLLGVDAELLAEHGPVDARTAAAMASGVRRALAIGGAVPDIGVSTTGVAGPAMQDGKAVGTVFVGIDSCFGNHVAQLDLADCVTHGDERGSRNRIRQAAVEAAIDQVYLFLKDSEGQRDRQ